MAAYRHFPRHFETPDMRRPTTRFAALFLTLGLLCGWAATAFPQTVDDTDTVRLQRALAKARRGERVTVAVIGGSITQGASASTPDKNYGSLVAKWWRDTFPKADVQFVNAGIGATGSNFGALRAHRDMLARQPDFVIAEYSVNDANVQTSAESLEGLVRQVLAQPNQPAVLLLFMMSEGGHNAQEWHDKVGQHYRLPRVSFRDVLWPEIKAGRAKWDEYEADSVHPNDRGHAFAANLVTQVLTDVWKKLPPDDQLPKITPTPAPRFSDLYEHTALFEAHVLKPVKNEGFTLAADGSYWVADKPGSRIEFDVEGRTVLLMDYHLRGPMGQARIQVDERPAMVREAWFPGTWGGYRQTDEVARDLPPGLHRVSIEILPEKHAESTGHEYRLFGLGAAGVAVPATPQ